MVERGDGELIEQIILERAAAGDRGFQKVFVAVEALRGLDRRPIGERRARGRRGRRLGVVVEGVVVEIVVRRIHFLALREILACQRSLERFVRRLALDRFAFGFGARRAFVALQQRILLQLLFAILGKLDVRQLQQLDRLLQLRRHHQRLALADLQPLRQRHGPPRILTARTVRPDRRAARRGRGRCLPACLPSALGHHRECRRGR